MNIGEAYKQIKKEFPSISISRIRFLEKEGLIQPKRSKGGTRSFSEKDILRIKNILDLQENQFYSLKAIKNNPKLLVNPSVTSKIVIKEYSQHDALKKAGMNENDFNDLVEYKYEKFKNKYTQQDVDRFSALAYLFSLGLGVKNLSLNFSYLYSTKSLKSFSFIPAFFSASCCEYSFITIFEFTNGFTRSFGLFLIAFNE